MTFDIAAIEDEIKQLDDQLDGLRIDELPRMTLSDFCIFNLTSAELAMAKWILWLATHGHKRRAAEIEQTLLARIKTRLLLEWGRREWLRGTKAGKTNAI